MAIRALNLGATRPYESVLDADRGKPGATVFSLGTLDSRVRGYLKDLMTKFKVSQESISSGESVETSMSQSEVDFETVRWGLRGWKNFQDAKGNDIKFETKAKNLGGSSTPYQVVPSDLVAMIPVEIVTELAGELRKSMEVTPEEKNV